MPFHFCSARLCSHSPAASPLPIVDLEISPSEIHARRRSADLGQPRDKSGRDLEAEKREEKRRNFSFAQQVGVHLEERRKTRRSVPQWQHKRPLFFLLLRARSLAKRPAANNCKSSWRRERKLLSSCSSFSSSAASAVLFPRPIRATGFRSFALIRTHEARSRRGSGKWFRLRQSGGSRRGSCIVQQNKRANYGRTSCATSPSLSCPTFLLTQPNERSEHIPLTQLRAFRAGQHHAKRSPSRATFLLLLRFSPDPDSPTCGCCGAAHGSDKEFRFGRDSNCAGRKRDETLAEEGDGRPQERRSLLGATQRAT